MTLLTEGTLCKIKRKEFSTVVLNTLKSVFDWLVHEGIGTERSQSQTYCPVVTCI